MIPVRIHESGGRAVNVVWSRFVRTFFLQLFTPGLIGPSRPDYRPTFSGWIACVPLDSSSGPGSSRTVPLRWLLHEENLQMPPMNADSRRRPFSHLRKSMKSSEQAMPGEDAANHFNHCAKRLFCQLPKKRPADGLPHATANTLARVHLL